MLVFEGPLLADSCHAQANYPATKVMTHRARHRARGS